MVTVLKDSHPVARKEHRCLLCNGTINKGQRYYRQTCVYDAAPYDCIDHDECYEVAMELDMDTDCDDEGLTDEIFREVIDEFIWDNFSEEESDRIYNLPYYEKVKIVLDKLKEKK